MNFKTPSREELRTAGITLLAVVGLIALLALATWGSVQVARVAPHAVGNFTAAVTNFTSQFFGDDDGDATLTFSMQTRNALSGEPFTFSWNTNVTADTYAFSYECRDGLTFAVPGSTEDETIVCDDEYTFSNVNNTLTLIPRSESNRFLDVPVTIIARADASEVLGTTLITVVNEDVSDSRGAIENGNGTSSATPTTVSPAGPSTEVQVIGGTGAVPTPSNPLGTADLFIRILAVGKIDENTNEFVVTNTVEERTDDAAVRFEVINVGTKASGTWNFRAELPTSPSHTFTPREDQVSLNPGERIEYTLAFDRVRGGTNDVASATITVDPFRALTEVTRENNVAVATYIVTD